MKTPAQLGLPPKFDKWRPGQDRITQQILDSRNSGALVQVVPTGGGKSICYLTAAVLLNGRTVILTSTKGLQDQLSAEFGDYIRVVKGQSAYRCRVSGYPVSHGPCHWGYRCPIKERGCEYFDAVNAARDARIVVTNYAFWFANEPEALGRFDMLVCDEAHDSVEQLLGSLSVSIRRDDVARMSQFPAPGKGMNYYLAWGHILAQRVEDRISDRKKRGATEDPEAVRLLTLKYKIERLKRVRHDNWIAEHKGNAIEFEPIWPGKLSESFLTRGIPRILFTSATVTRKTMDLLGITGYTYTEYPSYFPVNNRPIYYIPTVRMDHKAGPAEISAWLARIEQICSSRPSTKGIIHAVSYDRCKRIYHTSSHRNRMMTHDSDTTHLIVERFKESTEPKILVSPSVVTGFDFPYDQCRWQIIGKLPFPDGRSEVMKARTKIDPEYGMYLTMQALIQACGRGTRAPDDFCECFVIDDHFSWFIGKYRSMAQQWFLNAIKRTNLIPQLPNGGK